MAISADIEGLLASSIAENFDHIVPKPINIYEVGKLVEKVAEIADRAPENAEAAPAPGCLS